MKQNYPKLTPEQALELLKEENQLYADGFNERQVSGIMQVKIAVMFDGEDYGTPYDNRVKINERKLGTMAIGAWMLLGLAYGASALYDSCADSNYSKSTLPQEQNIEQIINNHERR